MLRPNYPYKPIGSLEVLGRILGLSRSKLEVLARDADNLYYLTKEIVKPDGSKRLTYDAKPRLKGIHEKISDNILKKVLYPDYLQGSLKGKDYLSNCRLHLGKKFIISEDATNFFPSISQKIIYEVFTGVFHFPHEVADCLSSLTTYNGYMVQGSKTSSYLANLVLWNREAELAESFKRRGYAYSRYVDDFTISSSRYMSPSEQRQVVSEVYCMLRTIGAAPNRKKHASMSNGRRQSVHRVNVNRRSLSLPKKERANLRAAVLACEHLFSSAPESKEYQALYNRTMGRICTAIRINPSQGLRFKKKLQLIKPNRDTGG